MIKNSETEGSFPAQRETSSKLIKSIYKILTANITLNSKTINTLNRTQNTF